MSKSVISDLLPTVLAGVVGYVLIKKVTDVLDKTGTLGGDMIESAGKEINDAADDVYVRVTGTPEVNLSTGETTYHDTGFWKGLFERKKFTIDTPLPTPGPDEVHGGGTALDAWKEHIGGYDDPAHKYTVPLKQPELSIDRTLAPSSRSSRSSRSSKSSKSSRDYSNLSWSDGFKASAGDYAAGRSYTRKSKGGYTITYSGR